MNFAIRLLVLLFLAWGASGQRVYAQSKKATAPKQPVTGGWTVNCASTPQGLRCQALQTVSVKKSRQRILTAAISISPKTKTPIMLFHLAHGIYLPTGVSLKVDTEKPAKIMVEFCNSKGCYARFPVAEAVLKSMKNGKAMEVGFQNLNKQTLNIQLSLKGFTAAYDKIK